MSEAMVVKTEILGPVDRARPYLDDRIGHLVDLSPEDTLDAIVDMVADLLHLAAAEGFDPDVDVWRRSLMHYEAESSDE
jgi:hypothetical protein